MHHTVFDTPILSQCMRALSICILRLRGWKTQNTLSPHIQKCVVIAAPHTSNWDMPIMLMVAFELRLHVYWVGKNSIFRFPFGGLMRWLGGISVDRGKQSGTVDQIVHAISSTNRNFKLVISPEGTRKFVQKWKTGFYHIAVTSSVPIACGYIDYKKKRAGIGFVLTPSGDMKSDMQAINFFYKPIEAKYPHLFSVHKLE